MTFKDMVLETVNQALFQVFVSDGFDAASKIRAQDLANTIREDLEWEDPENDTAIHEATLEVLRIHAYNRRAEDDASVPGERQADSLLTFALIELLKERNEQIHFNDLMGGSGV